jgi:hypothetical protein
MSQKTIYRQGDVLIKSIKTSDHGWSSLNREKLAQILPENGRVILAYGEATGHTHSIDAMHARMFKDSSKRSGVCYLYLDETSLLEHQEHGTIELPAGSYEVIRQREWDEVFGSAFVQD